MLRLYGSGRRRSQQSSLEEELITTLNLPRVLNPRELVQAGILFSIKPQFTVDAAPIS